MVNSEGPIVANETQILASAVVDLLQYSSIPSPEYPSFHSRAGQDGERRMRLCKTNPISGWRNRG